MTKLVRIGAAATAGALTMGLTTLPAGSQPLEPITITGDATCVVDGATAHWQITYDIHNDFIPPNGPLAVDDVSIDASSLSGAATGTPDFSPNPIPAGGDAFAAGTVDGDATGTLTLTVDWSIASFQMSGSTAYDLTLDGSCLAPATTTTSLPGPTPTPLPTPAPAPQPAVRAVVVTPNFTG